MARFYPNDAVAEGGGGRPPRRRRFTPSRARRWIALPRSELSTSGARGHLGHLHDDSGTRRGTGPLAIRRPREILPIARRSPGAGTRRVRGQADRRRAPHTLPAVRGRTTGRRCPTARRTARDAAPEPTVSRMLLVDQALRAGIRLPRRVPKSPRIGPRIEEQIDHRSRRSRNRECSSSGATATDGSAR